LKLQKKYIFTYIFAGSSVTWKVATATEAI